MTAETDRVEAVIAGVTALAEKQRDQRGDYLYKGQADPELANAIALIRDQQAEIERQAKRISELCVEKAALWDQAVADMVPLRTRAEQAEAEVGRLRDEFDRFKETARCRELLLEDDRKNALDPEWRHRWEVVVTEQRERLHTALADRDRSIAERDAQLAAMQAAMTLMRGAMKGAIEYAEESGYCGPDGLRFHFAPFIKGDADV